jgi:hypothetical protein
MLDPLWRLLNWSWPLNLPRALLGQEIGEEGLQWLQRSEVARSYPLEPGDWYPCTVHARSDCAMRVLELDGLLARCSLRPFQCPDIPLPPPDDVGFEVEAAAFLPMLQRALGLEQAWQAEQEIFHLGDRSFGATRVSFVFAPSPGSPRTRPALDWLASQEHPLVILTFLRSQLPPASTWRRELWWMALEDATPTEDGLVIPLLALQQRFAPGTDLMGEAARHFLFVADPERGQFLYGGCPLDLSRRSAASRLLTALLWHPGQTLPPIRLVPMVFPGQSWFDRRGELRDTFRQQLRRAKLELAQALRALPLREGLERDPIQSTRASSDTTGGYTLQVLASQIHWKSAPDLSIRGPTDPVGPRS